MCNNSIFPPPPRFYVIVCCYFGSFNQKLNEASPHNALHPHQSSIIVFMRDTQIISISLLFTRARPPTVCARMRIGWVHCVCSCCARWGTAFAASYYSMQQLYRGYYSSSGQSFFLFSVTSTVSKTWEKKLHKNQVRECSYRASAIIIAIIA